MPNFQVLPGGLRSDPIPHESECAQAHDLMAALLTNKDVCASLSGIVRFSPYVLPDATPRHDDFNVLGHLRNTLRLAKFIVPLERHAGVLSQLDAQLIYTAAVIHDLGELAWKNEGKDVNVALKNADHDRIEKEYFQANRATLFPTVPEDLLSHASLAFDQVVIPDTHAHQHSVAVRIFDCIERAGYLETAVTVFHDKPSGIDALLLPFSVLHRQIAACERLVPNSRAMQSFLATYATLFWEVLDFYKDKPELCHELRQKEAALVKSLLDVSFSELANRWRTLISLNVSSAS